MSDRRAWMKETMARWEGRLLRYAMRITGDLESARDVVQDTFLRLWEADPAKVKGDDHVAAWLFTVCKRRAVDHLRQESRMPPTTHESQARHLAAGPAGPGEVLERRQTASRVLSALDGLPDKQAEVVRLKFGGGLSYKQIADTTGQSVGNVGWLLHHALKSIRADLGATGGAA